MTAGASQELRDLRRLAALYGAQTRFVDALERRIAAPPDSLLAVLRSLGAPAERMADVPDAVREREHELWHRHVEPVLVAWDGRLAPIEVRVPAADAESEFAVEVVLEDGTRINGRAGATAKERRSEHAALVLTLDAPLPYGYHDLTVTVGGHEMRSMVIAAPRVAYSPPAVKRWGVFLPLYALHTERSWGAGDFTDLCTLVNWAAEEGAGFVATLPVLASFLEEPFEPSPYAPVSRLFWNEMYTDVASTVTESGGGFDKDCVVPAATARSARRLNARGTVPFREVMALKRRVLEQHTRPLPQDPANQAQHHSSEEWPALFDYSAFRAALETLGPSWRRWPERQRKGALAAGDYKPETRDYFAHAQRLAAGQVAALKQHAEARDVTLYLDLPVGVHPDGYDAWRHREQFAQGMNAGAPPDMFAADGQNWGFQPLNPHALRRKRYEYTRAYLRHHMEAAGILRIDHAIGLHRLFWIPEGAAGREGVFVRQPSEELYALLCLESHRNRCVVVGEDLGLVPREVTRGMARHGIARMYVQAFSLTGNARQPFEPPPRHAVASFGTHDMAPFAAFWTDEDLAQRRKIGISSPEGVKYLAKERAPGKRALAAYLRRRGLAGREATVADVYRGATRILAESGARWVMVNLEDAWGDSRPQNIPGTTGEQHANWTRRARYSLERFRKLAAVTEVTALMRSLRPSPGKENRDDY